MYNYNWIVVSWVVDWAEVKDRMLRRHNLPLFSKMSAYRKIGDGSSLDVGVLVNSGITLMDIGILLR